MIKLNVIATPSREGLTVRNLVLTRTLEWPEIIGIQFGGGEPWVSLDLLDGDTLAVMAIQKADGEVAGREAIGEGRIVTPPLILDAESLLLNVDSAAGEVRVQITNANGQPLEGFRFEDCEPIRSDLLAAPVSWTGDLSSLQGQPVRIEFSLRDAKLFAFESR